MHGQDKAPARCWKNSYDCAGEGLFSVTCVRVRGTISLVLEMDPSVASLYFNKRMKNSYKELKVQNLDEKGYSGEAVQGKSPFLL